MVGLREWGVVVMGHVTVDISPRKKDGRSPFPSFLPEGPLRGGGVSSLRLSAGGFVGVCFFCGEPC